MKMHSLRCAVLVVLLICTFQPAQASVQKGKNGGGDKITLAEQQLKEKERRRPVLASEWISSGFGREPTSAHTSLHETLVPASSPAFHRGAFLDNMLQMIGHGEEDSPEPQPSPRSQVKPITIQTLEGEYLVDAGGRASYIISIYYPEDKFESLWFSASLTKFYRSLPDRTHVIFAVSKSTPSATEVIQSMFERCRNATGYAAVQDRLHFMATPLKSGCTVATFPNCHGAGETWLDEAATAWGSVSPMVTASWQQEGEGAPLIVTVLDAVGDSGWLPPVTTVAKAHGGALRVPLAVWGGQACNASEHPSDDLAGKAVLIERGTCTFFAKVQLAAARGAAAVLIRSNSDGDMSKLSCGPPDACGGAGLAIPAVAVSRSDGAKLEALAAAGAALTVSFTAEVQGEHFLGVDHAGRLREVGAISLRERGADAWWYLALEAQGYEYERRLEARMADPAVTRVPVLAGVDAEPLFGGGKGIYSDVQLPPPGRMGEYDTLEVYAELACPGAWDKTCGAWDYVAQLHLCTRVEETPASPAVGRVDAAAAGSHASCTVEVGRWVTAYGRPGRWITDATAMLPLLRLGGRQHFRLSQVEWSAQRYRATVTLLLSRRGGRGGGVPTQSVFLFAGGAFDAGYNALADHAPLQFHVPAGTTRAEVHAVVSGHGWGADSDNCAEFCPSQHRFAVRSGLDVDGTFYVSRRPGEHTYNLSRAGEDLGCAEQVGEWGVTPNQYGTWRFGRAGWCPGGAVRRWVADVTRDLRPGLEGVVGYEGLLAGRPYSPKPCRGGECAAEGFPATITMHSYVVLYSAAPTPWP